MTTETHEFWIRLEESCGCTRPTSKDGFGNEWCNKCFKMYKSRNK
jgi:hypothetical protein